MTDPTPADELRAAAKKLRSRIDNLGGPEGQGIWGLRPESDSRPDQYVITAKDEFGEGVAATGAWLSTAVYITTVHPGVGLALADLLESTAATIDAVRKKHVDAAPEDAHWIAPALAVARQINGTPAPERTAP